MINNEKQIIQKTTGNINPIKKFHKKKIKEQKSIQLYRLIINILISFIVIAAFLYAIATYNPQWRMFYFLSTWSFLMNIYYLISITVIDLFHIISHRNLKKYNSFIRNYFIRICVPFSIMAVCVYWELVLLGDDFEKIGEDVFDYFAAVFLNGLVLVFLFFDMFTYVHIYKYNRCNDLIILTIIIVCYYLLLCLGRYLNLYEPYVFMMRSDVRQIIGAGIIVYVLLLNGYIVFDLLAYCCFNHEKEDMINSEILEDEMAPRKISNNKSINETSNFQLNYNDGSTNYKTPNSQIITTDNNLVCTNNSII